MAGLAIKTYRWALRIAFELLDFFPPKRLEKNELAMRKGHLLKEYNPPKGGSIWVHGASLGEVITLRPFLKRLCQIYGRETVVCTTTSMDGYKQLLKDELCGLATILPTELPEFINPFLKQIKPRVLLISETEIWPLTLYTLVQNNIPYGIINSRVNVNSIKLMKMAWGIFEPAINNLAFLFPQETQYQRRFKVLGVPQEKMQKLGCFKYDIVDELKVEPEELRKKLLIPQGTKVICFGSTHNDEEAQILDAFSPILDKFDGCIIIAPRHIRRLSEVETLLKARGIKYNRLSQPMSKFKRVLLVDTLGELRGLYSICDLAFVGGSLINRGGHNLMEPAAFAKPIVSGPNTFNFRYEMMALKKAKAIFVVKNPQELRELILNWLQNPEFYVEQGQKAKDLLNSMAGASERTIKALQKLGYLPNEK